MPTLSYYRRILSAYLLGGKSHLTFWHETPGENLDSSANELGPYYMLFSEKARKKTHQISRTLPRAD